MKLLVAVSAFVVVVAFAAPQWPISSYPWGLGPRAWSYQVSPYGVSHPITYSLPSTLPLVIAKETKSIEIPKAVEDTPEVKSGREVFLVEWEKQASVRKRRDVSPVVIPAPHLGGIPYTYSTVYGNHEHLPVSPHTTTRLFTSFV